jgi:hypothetical protein
MHSTKRRALVGCLFHRDAGRTSWKQSLTPTPGSSTTAYGESRIALLMWLCEKHGACVSCTTTLPSIKSNLALLALRVEAYFLPGSNAAT